MSCRTFSPSRVAVALAIAAMVAAVRAEEPACLEIDTSNVEVLREPCKDPALACSHDSGCIGAMVGWLAPQFEATRGTVDMSAYADITPAWMVKCMEPHIEDYMRVIPVSTFMGLQSCDYSGYIEQYPELGAFDMSSISATDFITAMPPANFRLYISG